MNKSVFSSVTDKALGRYLSDAGNAIVYVYAKLISISILLIFLMSLVKIPSKPAAVIVIITDALLLAAAAVVCRKKGYRISMKKITASSFLIPAMAIIQIAAVMATMTNQTHALYRIRYATSVYENGVLISKAPYMSFVGAVSSLAGVHPLAVIGTVSAMVIIPVSYLAYRTLAITVCGDNQGPVNAIMVCIFLLNLFGYQSDKAMTMTLLTGYYTIESLIIHIILPLTVAYLIVYARQKAETEAELKAGFENGTGDSYVAGPEDKTGTVADDISEDEDYQEEWDMKKHKIVNARNLAIALGILTVMLLAFVYILNSKINSLYYTTIGLQSEMNSSCRAYEFAPDGKIEGYIIENSDDSLTVIGGGSSENAAALADSIKEYGDTVDSWYLYGENEADTGAYEGCISSGITVKHVFVLERKDM